MSYITERGIFQGLGNLPPQGIFGATAMEMLTSAATQVKTGGTAVVNMATDRQRKEDEARRQREAARTAAAAASQQAPVDAVVNASQGYTTMPVGPVSDGKILGLPPVAVAAAGIGLAAFLLLKK